jgi:hypothetical protein
MLWKCEKRSGIIILNDESAVSDGTGHDPLKIFTRIYLQENHKNISVQQSNMEYFANNSYPQSNESSPGFYSLTSIVI